MTEIPPDQRMVCRNCGATFRANCPGGRPTKSGVGSSYCSRVCKLQADYAESLKPAPTAPVVSLPAMTAWFKQTGRRR